MNKVCLDYVTYNLQVLSYILKNVLYTRVRGYMSLIS